MADEIEGSQIDPVVPAEVVQSTPVAPVETDPVIPVQVAQAEQVPPKDTKIETPPVGESYQYRGKEIQIATSTDLAAQFAEKGIDITSVLGELTSSSDFKLNDNTKSKLSAIYGTGLVDSYVSGLKSQFDESYNGIVQEEEKVAESNKKLWEDTLEQVGGEENWNSLKEWISGDQSKSVVPDETVGDFNEVMSSGNKYAQKLAINDMMQRQKGEVGELVNLIKSDSSTTQKDTLTASEYQALYTDVGEDGKSKYSKNPSLYDAMRARGSELGL